jgi:hypothetical protein
MNLDEMITYRERVNTDLDEVIKDLDALRGNED